MINVDPEIVEICKKRVIDHIKRVNHKAQHVSVMVMVIMFK